MVQNDLKREIAKEMYIKMVLENQEMMETEHLVDTAKIAITVADVFVRVYENEQPSSTMKTGWVKGTNGKLNK